MSGRDVPDCIMRDSAVLAAAIIKTRGSIEAAEANMIYESVIKEVASRRQKQFDIISQHY